MKVLNIILSIYLIALACMPCADMETISVAHKIAQFASGHDEHSHDKETDLCSPFCLCNCCGTQIMSYFPEIKLDFNKITSTIKIPLPTYKSILSSNFFGSIWQPPQIA